MTARVLCLGLLVAGIVVPIQSARAQNTATGVVRANPNIGTQPRDKFIVCIGTAADRDAYGIQVTTSTGIVTFPNLPAGMAVVTTVNKAGYTGREQSWTTPAAGGSKEVIIYMFEGSGGPACPSAPAAPAAPAPPPPVSVQISVDPGTAGKDGFYVCVGNSTNREAYGRATTTSTGTVSLSFVPTTAMLKATVVKAGYKGVERDWYPTPGQAVVFTLPVPTGTPVYTCPGYVPPPKVSDLTVTVTDGGRPLAGAYVCVGAGTQPEKFAATRQTNGTGQVTFTNLPESEPWGIIVGKDGRRGALAVPAPHRRDTAVTLALGVVASPLCPGTPPAPVVRVDATTTTALSPEPAPLGLQTLALRGDPLFTSYVKPYGCERFGSNYVLVGLRVRHSVMIMHGMELYCAALQANGTLGTAIFLPTSIPTEGTVQDVKCPAGRAVSGYKGTIDNSSSSPAHLRSITLYCAVLGSNGLTTGTSSAVATLGINSGPAWGPDMCASGRPARDIRFTLAMLTLAPTTVGAWQLGCAQPTRPQP